MNMRKKLPLLATATVLILSLPQVQARATEITMSQTKSAKVLFPLADGTTADKVVAVIDQHPILLSELDLEARVVLIVRGGTAAAFAKKLGDDVLSDMLTQLIDQRLLENEANRLQTRQMTSDETAKVYDAFVQKIGGLGALQAFLAMHEMSEQRLLTVLERLLRIDQFLSNKLGATARVTEADAKEYFDANADAFGGRPFSSVKKSIVDKLIHERVKSETAQFLESLRERSEIRLLPPFSPENAAYDLKPRDNMVRVRVNKSDSPRIKEATSKTTP